MKVTVYYDSKGDIQSVVFVHHGARTNPKSEHYASLEVEMDDVSSNKLVDIHSKYHVDTAQRKLLRR